MMMKCSIITSIFNADDMVDSFLENISEQTIYSQCMHYLVQCDTNEYTNNACVNHAQKYPNNVRYDRILPDPGIYNIWNMVCFNVDTPYITNANIDDRLYPTCLEKHVELLDNNEDVDIAYCYNAVSQIPNASYKSISPLNRYPTGHYSGPRSLVRSNLPHNHPVWRSDLHIKHGYFNTDYFSAADWEFWLRCACEGAVFQLIPETLGIYYWNPNGISTNKKTNAAKMREENQIRRLYQRKVNELSAKS